MNETVATRDFANLEEEDAARKNKDTIRFVIPKACSFRPKPKASIKPPQDVDPRLFEYTNGRNPTDARYSDAQFEAGKQRIENADHGEAEEASENAQSDCPNGLAKNPELEDKLVKEKVLILIMKTELVFFMDRPLLESCSSARLRKHMACLKPTSPPIIWLPFEVDVDISFYLNWLKGNPIVHRDKFSSEIMGDEVADWDGLLRLYCLGWRMHDYKFLNFIVKKWIKLQDRKLFCANLAQRIYAELPRHSTLTRLYVETWAVSHNELWIKHTLDGRAGPWQFMRDVCHVQQFLTSKYGRVPENIPIWRCHHRYCYPQRPKQAAAAPGPNGVQQPTATGNQVTSQSRADTPAETVEKPANTEAQFEEQASRRFAGRRRRSARPESPPPESDHGVESSRDERQSDAAENPVSEEIAKRWTSNAVRLKFGF